MYEGIKKIPNEGSLYADPAGNIYNFLDGQMFLCNTFKNHNGYLFIDPVFGKFKSVHRLVASAFHGDVRGFEVDHINRNRTDNRSDNLQILTKAEHLRKTRCRGEQRLPVTYQNTLKLVDRTEILICLKWHSKYDIAKVMCLSQVCVNSVELQYKELKGKKWRKLYREHIKVKKNKARIRELRREIVNFNKR